MDTEKVAEQLATWIKNIVSVAGCKGVVVGMSGGIDSSVVAVFCHHALPKAVLGVIMPCHSIQQDIEHAQLVARKFNIATKIVELDSVYDSLLKLLPDKKADNRTAQLDQANLKARLRMVTLYYLANQLGYMVAGSSNRSELSTGYFTKYGDGGVDFMPLGSLVKKHVRKLAHYLGIPKPIIDKPPSAGLWHGQTDEAEMGISYEELDRYLLTGEAQENVKNKIDFMTRNSEHKRQLPPIVNLQL